MPVTIKANSKANVKSFSDNDTLAINSQGASSFGGKNYMSPYVASQGGGVANPGNGNFENGTVGGWSLAHSALTNGFPTSNAGGNNPFSSASGGSAASGNLSFAALTGGTQIAGTTSGLLASSATSVAGDLVVSSPFFIDSDDQGRMLGFSLAYKVVSGATNLVFNGLQTGSFAIALYDLANNTWIQPAGTFNFVQNNGAGLATGTFQAASNATKYQIAIINITASGGAYSLALDDVFVGPMMTTQGPAMTNWQAYTPTVTNAGTVTNMSAFYRRVGDTLQVTASWKNGTVAGGVPTMSLPPGLAIDATKVSFDNTTLGIGVSANTVTQAVFTSGTTYLAAIADVSNPSAVLIVYHIQGSSSTEVWENSSNGLASNVWNELSFSVPIAGWASNSTVSSDTDTRVVAARYVGDGVSHTFTTSAPYQYNTQVYDTHAAVTVGTSWKFTAPVAGFYRVTITADNRSDNGQALYKNGTIVLGASELIATQTNGTGATTLQLNAGDFIDIRPTISVTVGQGATQNSICIERLSGPAVVSATESVNFSAFGGTPGGTISASDSPTIYSGVIRDSHNAYNASTGTYTVPVAGMYRVSASIFSTQSSSSANSSVTVSPYKSGVQQAQGLTRLPAGMTGETAGVSCTFPCKAGDTIIIQSSNTNSGPAYGSSNSNYVSIERIGN